MASRYTINSHEIDRLILVDGRQYVLDVSRAVLAFARFNAPRKSGQLASSGRIRGPESSHRTARCTVVFTARHAIWVHDGTGLYGPLHHYITPRRARFLHWTDERGEHFARRVRGMPARPFLENALREVCEPLGFTIRDVR